MNKLKNAVQRLSPLLLLAALAATLAPHAKAADAVPSFKYARVMIVNVTDHAALEQVTKGWAAFVKKEVPSYFDWQFRTDDLGRASWVFYANELSEFSQQDTTFQAAVEKYRASGLPDLNSAWLQSFTSADLMIWEHLRDLAYVPAGSEWMNLPFRAIRTFHLKRDKEQAFVDALKTLNDVDRKLGITTSRLVFRLKYGPDQPAIAVVSPAKDVTDYYTGYAKRTELRQKDAQGKEVLSLATEATRSSEIQHITIHPELSKRSGN